MNDIAIVAALRTPIGKFQGSLAGVPATDLGAHVIHALLAKTGVAAEEVSEVIMGQVLTAGCGQNPARQAALHAGLPNRVPASTVNKVCGSGMKAVHLAAQAIRCGDADIVIAGGQENMSAAPYVLPGAREGFGMGDAKALDSMIVDGLWDAFNQYHMGITAENIAIEYGVTREAQDQFAARSQQRAEVAQRENRFIEEIAPIEVASKKGDFLFAVDEFPRHGTTTAGLSALKPVFRTDGTVTAGNASGLNDGAAALMMMSAAKAEQLGLRALVYIRAHDAAGVDPRIMGMGPVSASRRCLTKANWGAADPQLIELNEAFAAQSLAVMREMQWDNERVNVNGGAIALGHPLGASGCRILVTLIHEMIKRGARKGLAALCIGGGMGIATALER